MSERPYPPDQWIPDIPADASVFDGDPPVPLEELPAAERAEAERALAVKRAARRGLADGL